MSVPPFSPETNTDAKDDHVELKQKMIYIAKSTGIGFGLGFLEGALIINPFNYFRSISSRPRGTLLWMALPGLLFGTISAGTALITGSVIAIAQHNGLVYSLPIMTTIASVVSVPITVWGLRAIVAPFVTRVVRGKIVTRTPMGRLIFDGWAAAGSIRDKKWTYGLVALATVANSLITHLKILSLQDI